MGGYAGLSWVFWQAADASAGILSEGSPEEELCVRGGLQPPEAEEAGSVLLRSLWREHGPADA